MYSDDCCLFYTDHYILKTAQNANIKRVIKNKALLKPLERIFVGYQPDYGCVIRISHPTKIHPTLSIHETLDKKPFSKLP